MECTYDTCLPVHGVHNIPAHSMQESHANAAYNRAKAIIAAAIRSCIVQLTRDQRPVWHELHPELGQSRTAAAGGLVQARLQNPRPC